MIIAIDALPAIPGKSGAVGAIRNMLQIAPRIDEKLKIIVFVNPAEYEYYSEFVLSEYAPRITLVRLPIPNYSRMLRILIQNTIIPYLCDRLSVNVHFSMNPEPIFRMPTIVEVFKIADLQFIDVPQEIGNLKATYRILMGRRKINRAKLIIANSNYTKNKIMESFKVGPDRIEVVYEAVDHAFFNTDCTDNRAIDTLRQRYSVDYPFILYVSSYRPYKNHKILLDAFGLLKKRGLPHHLVLIGNDIGDYKKRLEEKAEECGLVQSVHFFEFIHHWDLGHFYRTASLAVYPSELETFGIPPLEAMACGVPVIVSDKTAMPEVSGEGALVVDPHDIERMAEEMYRIITNKDVGEALRCKGLALSKRYTWERNISETLNIINKVIS